jgi:hypothetical protein
MIDSQSDSGPVIVRVDGSERSVEALAVADLLGPALGRRVVITGTGLAEALPWQ